MDSSGKSSSVLFSLPPLPGSGEIRMCWQPGSSGLLAISGGADAQLYIYNRHGKQQERINLPGPCSSLCWDADGDLLAAAADKSSRVLLWDAHVRRSHPLDTGLGDSVSFLMWNRNGPPMLAVGTVKGNLMLYNHKTAKRLPVLGKHTRRVTCGAWSKEGLLALGSEDRNLTISNTEGDTLRAITLRAEPSHVRFSEMKLDERLQGENTVSMLIGKKTLFLYNMHDPENPVELAFQQRYGSVVTYEWFGDGYILLGFSAGYFVAISTHMKEIGQELFQVKNHRDSLSDIALCASLAQAASCGDNLVKLHSLSELPETRRVLSLETERTLTRLAWSSDGQLLAAGGSSGSVHVFLLQLPPLASAGTARAALLTSLAAISITRPGFQEPLITVNTEVEPSFLAIGSNHVACGMNNRVWFYSLGENSAKLLHDQEYLGTVSSMHLNADYASVLFEGRLQLHLIGGDNEEREAKIFPEQPLQNERITCHALTSEMLIYGTEMGTVTVFFLEEWKIVQVYKHSSGIRGVYPEPAGCRVALLDEHRQATIYCPVTEQIVNMPGIPVATDGIMWDTWPADHSVLIAYDKEVAITFVLVRESIDGPYVSEVGTTKLPQGQSPLWLSAGELGMHTSQGRFTKITLDTHITNLNTADSVSEQVTSFNNQLALRRYKDAWQTCSSMNSEDDWKKLAETALKDLEIEIAVRSFRELKNAGMVWALEDMQEVEDRNLLTGHIALFLKDFNKAQEWYLKSSHPMAALEMQRDLLQWEEALQLASTLAPSQIPFLAREFAQQLEFTGQYAEARSQYERASMESQSKEHDIACKAGLARTSLRCGDVRRGLALVNESGNRNLMRECAEILETTKQLSEAAILFEKGMLPDKAADLYIRLKNWSRVGELLPQITSPKIHIQYAKAKEAEGRYAEAVRAYEAARDYDNVIRVLLEHLKNPEQAVKVVKETKSVEGAKMVAKFFRQLGDVASALQFLVASHCTEEAFQLARQSGQMALYGRLLGLDASAEDYRSVARHFEAEQDLLLAGRYFHLAGDDAKAIKYLLKSAQLSADNKEALQLAVEAAGASEDQTLADQVIHFVCGDVDGVPKDFKYVFRLYIARKQFEEASQVAIMMAEEEQKAGNYRNAHDTLLSMYQELRSRKMHAPEVLRSRLALLHSYTLARLHVRRGEHLLAARMLARVAANISKFPAHVVPILTSAVIECHRAGLKTTAFNLATILMRPLHRPHLDPKYKRKIESVVRKPVREPEPPEPTSPCPYCEQPLEDTELICTRCKNSIPFCIATGRHIIKEDYTACPHCEFPAIKSEFAKLLQTEHACPMCANELDISGLSSLENIKHQLYPDEKVPSK